jgi:CRISPR-associated endonuclease/helicase Cas3
MSLFSYWGKSDSKNETAVTYHPLVYHSLDVAACGRILLEKRPDWLERFSAISGINESVFIPWVTFLLAIHDLGKFSDGFQNQIPDLFKELQGRSTNAGYNERHDTLGFRYAVENITKVFGPIDGNKEEDLKDLLKPWLGAVTGHHGRPPAPPMNPVPLNMQFPQVVHQDILEFVKIIQTLFIPNGLPFKTEDYDILNEKFTQSSWLMAGFAVLCDWLGSNRTWLPYTSQTTGGDLKTYWKCALSKAETAVKDSGLWPRQISKTTGIGNLFQNITEPTPLQKLTDETQKVSGPQLVVIEEITGSGKTEAALNLAHHWMADGLGTGIYFALPTMATANAMLDRVRENYRKFFTGPELPNLVLAHSAARMRMELGDKNRPDHGYRQEGSSASEDCGWWLSDNRKKALLADFGVGTIDQALLGVLPARHQALRLLGLAPKILVVDEVHACDAYVLKLLENLLKFHAAFGGSAILLSATLPKHMRSRLLQAFAQGAGWEKVEARGNPYPLFTRLSEEGLEEKTFPTRKDSARQVRVEMFHSEAQAKDRLKETVQNGGCACWVRNTVADAMEAYGEMSQTIGKDKIHLFHARFVLGDRLGLEDKVKEFFGPKSGTEQRTGKLLIATQVVEQSLDLDFDYLLTDLAPMDLVIQRAGRLRRHKRDKTGMIKDTDERGEIVLGVLGPDLEKADKHWYSRFFPKAEKVYPHHGRLWLTAKWFQAHGHFSVPGDMRKMIEAVYGEEAVDGMPELLTEVEDVADGKDSGDKSLAKLNSLVLETGYGKGDGRWEDAEAPTRLGEPTVLVRLAKQDEKKDWIPWCKGNGHDWQLSQLAVRRYWANQEPSHMESVVSKLKKGMPDGGRYCLVIPLKKSDGKWEGSVLNAKNKEVAVTYDETMGFQITGEVGE